MSESGDSINQNVNDVHQAQLEALKKQMEAHQNYKNEQELKQMEARRRVEYERARREANSPNQRRLPPVDTRAIYAELQTKFNRFAITACEQLGTILQEAKGACDSVGVERSEEAFDSGNTVLAEVNQKVASRQ
jgi:hypothetical protein